MKKNEAKNAKATDAKKPVEAKPAKATKEPKAKAAAKKDQKPRGKRPGQMSGLDAVAKVLAESKKPMSCNEMVESAFAKKLWASNGKTPSQTIYAAIIREIARKGKESRFKKTDRGQFEATGK